jgi:TonB family protein
MEWMIKVNINLLLLAAVYKYLFSKHHHLLLARVMLLLIPLASAILPIVQFQPHQISSVAVVALNQFIVSNNHIQQTLQLSFNWLIWFYFIGLAVAFVWLLLRLVVVIYDTGRIKTAYSFFNRIVVPASTSEEMQMMRLHEEAHVAARHSVDVLYYELVKCVFWFNPIVYYLQKSIKEIHEFAADAAALKQFTDEEAYCKLILDDAFYTTREPLIHSFHAKTTTYKRIYMITQKNTPRIPVWKYMALLPILVLVFGFSSSSMGLSNLFMLQTNKIQQKGPDVMPEFKGGQQALMDYLGREIKYPLSAKAEGVEGKVILSFVVSENGSITKVKNLTPDVDGRLVEEAIRVVSAMPAWTPAKTKNKNVSALVTLPIMFKL